MTIPEKMRSLIVEEHMRFCRFKTLCETCPFYLGNYKCSHDNGKTCDDIRIKWLESEVEEDD